VVLPVYYVRTGIADPNFLVWANYFHLLIKERSKKWNDCHFKLIIPKSMFIVDTTKLMIQRKVTNVDGYIAIEGNH